MIAPIISYLFFLKNSQNNAESPAVNVPSGCLPSLARHGWRGRWSLGGGEGKERRDKGFAVLVESFFRLRRPQ